MSSGCKKILKLCETLSGTSTADLEIHINKYLKSESESEIVFFINILNISEEAVIQVVNNDKVIPSIRISLPDDSINKIYEESLLAEAITDLDKADVKIREIIENATKNLPENITIVPVIAKNCKDKFSNELKEVPAFLICFINSKQDANFIANLTKTIFKYCQTLLMNTRECEEERRLKEQCKSLLLVARRLFSHLGDLSDLLKEIMSEARNLTHAERCSLFLLDPDHMHLVAKVFDGVSPAESNNEVRIAKDQGIAGHVAVTGEMLNIKDAYKHPLFYKGMDEATGFKTRNILCFPIRDEEGIVGVAQLCNKIGGHFDYFDEQVADAFSIYCGISIMHSLVYKRIQDAQARSQLSNELMMYHMQVRHQDVQNIVACKSCHNEEGFSDFSYVPRNIPLEETPCYVLKMFEDLNFINHFNIRKEPLVRFILYVRKGYRDLPYHNWNHAFAVVHFAYICIKNFKLIDNGYISKLEGLALLTSCLCHDIDHRGTTNSFQQQSNTVLASLYSSEGSVMERHHLAQTLATLNSEGCNFLESLNRTDYITCLDLIKDMILATDLATHYKIRPKQMEMAKEGYKRENPDHRHLLLSLLMTCSDLSDQTKDWIEARKISQLIYAEFFRQGDLEKKMGKTPDNMMDREKASIPDHQLDFLSQVCQGIFELLATIFPAANVCVNNIVTNIEWWKKAKGIFERMCSQGRTAYDVVSSEEFVQLVQENMK